MECFPWLRFLSQVTLGKRKSILWVFLDIFFWRNDFESSFGAKRWVFYFVLDCSPWEANESDFTSLSARDISFGPTIFPKSFFSHLNNDMLRSMRIGMRGTELRTVIDKTVSRAPVRTMPALINANKTAHARRFHRFGSAPLWRFLAEMLERT